MRTVQNMSGAYRFNVGDVVMVSAIANHVVDDALGRRSKVAVVRGVVDERRVATEGRRYASYTVVLDPPVGKKLRTVHVSEHEIVGLASEYTPPSHRFFTVITAGPLFFLRVPDKPAPKWRDVLRCVGALVRPYGIRIRDVQLEGRDGRGVSPMSDAVMKPREYVRLTYTPSGAMRARTVWAYVVSRSAKRVMYREVNVEGEDTFDGGTKDGEPIVQQRLIVATPAEVKERPARMSRHYAMLEIVK